MANYNSILSQVRQQLRLFSENEKIIDENHVKEVIDEIFDGFKRIWKPSEDMRSRLKSDLATEFFLEYTNQSTQFGNNENQNHEEWLDENRKADIDQSTQWESFYEFVAENRTPQDLLNLSRNADLILGKMEDPSRQGKWKSKSLVIGEVQSGKTENMLALCNKASAAGYRFIIVLAGLSETLRIQTQERFDKGFIGSPSTGAVSRGGNIGVGKHRFKSLVIDCDTGAGPQNDWVASKRDNNIQPKGRHGNVILIIKKHTSMLEGIVENIDRYWDLTPEGKVGHLPIMVIDDECDNASINMRGDDPTPTNKAIRKLLNKFNRYAYVGFTATAYANIFIDHVYENKDYGEDLFPDYITLLSTPPSYCGFEKYFPQSDEYTDEEEENKFVDFIDDNIAEGEKQQVDDYYQKRKVNGRLLKKNDLEFKESWLSPTHDPSWIINCNKNNEELPRSLKNAIHHFILCCAVKKIREISNPEIFSMLVHVSYYTEVQHQVINHILKYLKNFEPNNIVYEEYEKELKEYFINEFSNLINNENNIDQLPIKWVEVKDKLRGTIANIDVIPMNNKIDKIFTRDEKERNRELQKIWNDEYSNVSRYEDAQKRGSDCICIGGNQLSRGLTLTGLAVSYFLRTPKTMLIDTMTQMGRWFGYRGRYEDICKLYTSSYIYNSFCEMNEIKDNLTAQLREMKNKSAREIGLYLLTQGNINPTRSGAMRNAERVNFKTNFSGTHPQQLKIDLISNEKNRETVNQFLSTVDNNYNEVAKSSLNANNCLVWEEVDTNLITKDFLSKFICPKAANFLEKSSINHFHHDYIEEVSKNSHELRKWTVVFVTGGDSEIKDKLDFNGMEFNATLRKPTTSTESGGNPYKDWDGTFDKDEKQFDYYPIKALTDTSFEEIDLRLRKHPHEWLEYEKELKEWETKKKNNENIRIPVRKLIKKHRQLDYGLLLIYPIFPTEKNLSKKPTHKLTPYYCYALSFPVSDYAIKHGESMFQSHRVIGNKVLKEIADWEKQNQQSDD